MLKQIKTDLDPFRYHKGTWQETEAMEAQFWAVVYKWFSRGLLAGITCLLFALIIGAEAKEEHKPQYFQLDKEVKTKVHFLSDQASIAIAMKFIAQHEGMSLTAYPDYGSWSICFGNRSYEGETTNIDDCHQRLKYRTAQVYYYVKEKYKSKRLTNSQLASLTSIHYNVKDVSDLTWRILNDMSDKSIANAFRLYVHAGNQRLPGLVKRRENEIALFFNQQI